MDKQPSVYVVQLYLSKGEAPFHARQLFGIYTNRADAQTDADAFNMCPPEEKDGWIGAVVMGPIPVRQNATRLGKVA